MLITMRVLYKTNLVKSCFKHGVGNWSLQKNIMLHETYTKLGKLCCIFWETWH